MKGIVFTELFDMVEEAHGYAAVDNLIRNCKLSTDGVYTSVGTYPSSDMFVLVGTLSEQLSTPIPDLLFAFGGHLFHTFTQKYQSFFQDHTHAFDFLVTLHDHIHVEVKKLYPDAELPNFEYQRANNQYMEMTYTSERKMSDLANGLLHHCLGYYDHRFKIEKENVVKDGSVVLFKISIL